MDQVDHQAKQKTKTKEYWDTFYAALPSANDVNKSGARDDPSSKINDATDDETTSDLEWIVPNSIELLDTILSLFPSSGNDGYEVKANAEVERNDSSAVNVLEIGCGVSQLSLSLLRRILLKKKEPASPYHNRACSFVATEVSSVCIEHNQKRDNTFISSVDTKDGCLSYQFLDVLNTISSSETTQKYDIILDKGTLDTFLFRSKRTKKGTASHPPLLTPLLNNTHRWLRSGCKAKYIIISPRPKIKSVRDFRGFASVRRIKVDTTGMGEDVVLVKGNSEKSTQAKTEVYLYECTRNDSYNPEEDSPYFSLGYNTEDESTCEKCGVSFKDFRGKAFDQGEIVWARRWKNHGVHCKGAVCKWKLQESCAKSGIDFGLT